MFAEMLSELCVKATGTKSDPSTMGIIFMACLCAVLPLDISQLSFAILGAVLYAMLQKHDKAAEKKANATAPSKFAPRTPKPKVSYSRPQTSAQVKAVPYPGAAKDMRAPSVQPSTAYEVRAPSVQPILAPTFASDCWDGEIQELLCQIAPTLEAERIVKQLAQLAKETMHSMIPEIEVHGFVHGNLTFGKAFGVAVPEVDIVANVSPHILFSRLHGRGAQCSSSQIDEKKLQKSAIRACCDRLVSAAGFKFRRSAFRGHEPKVTLLAPASLGFFSESIPIDFSINVVTPLYNTALIEECGRIDRRAKDLILIVKRWVKDRGICHAAKGHLSPYMWGLLSVYFLQVGVRDEGALLPPLEQFEMSSVLLKGKRTKAPASQQPK